MALSVITLISVFSFILIPCCAAITSRIFGGAFATPNQFPHQVSLLVGGYHSCGGSIINENAILTAAHCAVSRLGNPKNMSDVTVVAGTNSLLNGGSRHSVRKAVAHRNYKNDMNDIALLFLNEPLEFSESIQPIELATEEIPTNANVTISGFGLFYRNGPTSGLLKYNTLFVVPEKDCAIESGIESDGIFCLGHSANNGACSGDSGGPAIYNNKLVGVASFILSECGSTSPDGYAKVSYYVDWIQKNIAKNL